MSAANTEVSASRSLLARLISPEVVTFLAVGGAGYVVDVASFNALRSYSWLSTVDPSYARVVAVSLAMVVTYLGNRLLTWRGQTGGARRREIGLFVVFNVIGFGPSLGALLVSHDLLGLTSTLEDNISANVVGLALGTLFRYWSYKRFVFAATSPARHPPDAVVTLTGVGTQRSR
jgi:putative flippase GtrA